VRTSFAVSSFSQLHCTPLSQDCERKSSNRDEEYLRKEVPAQRRRGRKKTEEEDGRCVISLYRCKKPPNMAGVARSPLSFASAYQPGLTIPLEVPDYGRALNAGYHFQRNPGYLISGIQSHGQGVERCLPYFLCASQISAPALCSPAAGCCTPLSSGGGCFFRYRVSPPFSRCSSYCLLSSS